MRRVQPLLAVSIALAGPLAALADEPAAKPESTTAAPAKPDLRASLPADPEASPAPPTNRTLGWLEVVGVNLTLNISGRVLKPQEDSYDFTLETWKTNLKGGWEYDPNSYRTNQYAHPYEGSLFMTSCRSLGLQFWEGFGCTFVGSFIWETLMEIHPPSINDQITTTVAGSYLGEVLYRVATDILDSGPQGSAWHELAAAAVAPMNGFNRLFYSDKFHDYRMRGFLGSTDLGVSVGVAGQATNAGDTRQFDAGSVSLFVRTTHGLPTDDGWRFRRPFDHYYLSTSLVIDRNSFTNASGVSLLIYGLLLGGSYGEGVTSGLWGLFGAYDVITAAQMRASTSAFAFGTVKQWSLSPGTRLIGTGYIGAGFGAAGTSAIVEDKRDYHFGAQAIAYLDLKLLWSNRLRVRASAREYVTGDQLSPDQGGYEDLTYALGEVSFRILGGHSLGVNALGGRRKAHYPDVPDVDERFRQLSIVYQYVTEPSMGSGRLIEF